jgi:Na+/H+ antiporter NhaD/arsenite permease-like protein
MARVAAAKGPEYTATLQVLIRYHFDMVMNGTVTDSAIMTGHIIANYPLHLQAISLAAVFFGAMTYIGNGPNFMVKSIAEQTGVKCPSFFGYVFRYSLPILLPIFATVWFLFFRS